MNPLLGIALALRERGHRTTLLSAPQFRDAAQAVGAEFASLGTAEEYDAVYAHPDLWHPRRGLGVFFPYAARQAQQTAALIEERWTPRETVVVATFQCFGARVAQESIGVPLCTVLPNPILLQSVHDPNRNPIGNPPRWLGKWATRMMYRVINREVSRHARRGVNAARSANGLAPPVRDIVGWSRSPDVVLGLWPAVLARAQSDWPPQARTTGFVPYDGPASSAWVPPSHLEDRSDWIVVTPGTQMTHGVDFFQMACEAVSRLGRPTLMVTQDASVLPESLPSNVQHLPFAPFRWLFDRSAAVVHHGGIGTVGRALSAGVPQLIVPSGFDQFDNAERVIRLGVGRSLERIRLSASTLLETLSGMLDDPSVQERCAGVRERIAESDPLGETCSAIEALFD